MKEKDRSKQLLIIGIVGCLLYVTGDFLFAATGKGQTTETIGFMVRVAYLDMGTWRMIASILCGFVGTFLYYMSVIAIREERAVRRMKYHIEKNTVQETLVIPLFGRVVCSERFPELFSDPEAKRICDSLDYDFAEKRKKMETPAGLFGALEVAQRQYDLRCEVETYLKDHPDAAVVNLGCGLDDTFSKVDNGQCRGYNLDLPDVIRVRDELLPAGDREKNIGCDLNNCSWMDALDASNGAVFFAAGVFYYFKTEDIKKLFTEMAERFPGAALAFDSCNECGAKLMRKTWLKEAGITDVNAFFSLKDEKELKLWSDRFASVTAKSYMRGYRDIYRDVGAFHKLMIRFCDSLVNMKIVKITFK